MLILHFKLNCQNWACSCLFCMKCKRPFSFHDFTYFCLYANKPRSANTRTFCYLKFHQNAEWHYEVEISHFKWFLFIIDDDFIYASDANGLMPRPEMQQVDFFFSKHAF